MVLEEDRAGTLFVALFRATGGTRHFEILVDGVAVVFHGDLRIGGLRTGRIEFRGGEIDIVGLPAQGRVAEILFRLGDFVDATAFVVDSGEAEAILPRIKFSENVRLCI